MDRAYPSNLTHKQWNLIRRLLPKARLGGRPRTTDLKLVVNAIFYVNRTGCQWRYLPSEFPPWQTVYDYFSKWLKQGIWHKVHRLLVHRVRLQEGRSKHPSLAIVDAQSVRAHFGRERAKDVFKKVIGRKRSILVDTLGFLLGCHVHKANDQDCHGCLKLFDKLSPQASRSLEKIIADMGYRGPLLREEALYTHGIEFETIDRKKLGTNMKPKRWIVERTIAWFNHYRRLSRDYEKICAQSEAMIFISQIQMLLKRTDGRKPSFRNRKTSMYSIWLRLFRHPPAKKTCVIHLRRRQGFRIKTLAK